MVAKIEYECVCVHQLQGLRNRLDKATEEVGVFDVQMPHDIGPLRNRS